MAKRYTNGSIQRYRKYDGSWEWRAHVSVMEDGRRRQLSKMLGIACDPPKEGKDKTGGKGSNQAKAAMRSWVDGLKAEEEAKLPDPSVLTVPQFVERYIDTVEVEPGTRQGYMWLLKHIRLLDVPVAELTTPQVDDWKRRMESAGIGASMRNKSFNLLKYALRKGVKDGMLAHNACDSTKPPRRKKHEPNPLEASELPALLVALDRLRPAMPEFADLAALALNTGMRRGELCALRFRDIGGYADGSFDGCISVANVIASKTGGTYVKDCPKNGHRRRIDVNEPIREILTRRLAAVSESTDDVADAYVFSRPATPMSYLPLSYVTKQWTMFARMNGLVGVEGSPLRFHDLRDTFATTALVNGVPVETVASILGHSDPTVTHRYYFHFLPSKNREAMDAIGGLLNAG